MTLPSRMSFNATGVRAVLTAGAGFAARVTTAFCQFASVRLLSEALGIDGFAAYLTVASLQTWFLLSDLGYGAAIQNFVSGQRVKQTYDPASTLGAVLILLGVSIVLALLLLTFGSFAGSLNIPLKLSVDAKEFWLALAVFGSVVVVAGAGGVIYRLLFAVHLGVVAHLASAAAAVLGLGSLAVCISLIEPLPLHTALLANFLPIAVCPLLAGLIAFRGVSPVPVVQLFRRGWATLRHLGAEAGSFLTYAGLAACVLNVDYIVLARFATPSEILAYTISTRVVGLFFLLFSSFAQAAWPLSSEHIHNGDTVRLGGLIRTCLIVGGVSVSFGGVVLAMWPGRVAALLMPGKSVVLSYATIASITLYWVVRVWCDTFTTIIMSAGRVKVMRIIVPVQAVLNVSLMIVGYRWYGLPGMVCGSTASFLLTAGWLFPVWVSRELGVGRQSAG